MTDKIGYVKELYKRPPKDKGVNMPHIWSSEKNAVHQADLLYMPEDKGFQYGLVLVDVYDGTTDAEPIKNRDATTVLNAFKKIYSRGLLKEPGRLETDAGVEFKGAVAKYFKDKGIQVKTAKVNRHRQVGLVERRNQQISVPLFKRMTAQELLTGTPSTEWIEDLPGVLKEINKNAGHKELPEDPVCSGKSCELLDVGTKVRAVLDQPIDVTNGKRLKGNFRATDIRFGIPIRTVKQFIISPGFPPLYLLDDDKAKNGIDISAAYTRNQLLVVQEPEEPISQSVIRGNPKYIIEKLIDKRKEKGKIQYKVKWKNYPESQSTWEPKSQLIKDVPKLVAEFDAVVI